MNSIQYCKCGSPMSIFEVEKYNKCGACQEKEKQMQSAQRKKELEEQKEKERLEKEEKQRKEKEAFEAEQKRLQDFILNQLSTLKGKTVTEVGINGWKKCFSRYNEYPKSLYISAMNNPEDDTEIETTISIDLDKHMDGCRGCYDYDYSLSVN